MGLFDTVHCEYPLPEARHQGLEFQTKNLECMLGRYTITRDGRLTRHALPGGRGPGRDIEWPIHGDVSIYTRDRSEDAWVEYVARFTHGRVEWIRSVEEARRAPGFHDPDGGEPFPVVESIESEAEATAAPAPDVPAKPSEVAAAGPQDAEEALLQSLRRDRRKLEELLARCSDHWGYEDPVYRFYHQSFKVYGLQQSTRSIVQRLQALAPDFPLNPWFVQIVESGTGKVFQHEDSIVAAALERTKR